MVKIARKITILIFCLWIFSIPTSLAWHYNKQAGLVSGVLVDYRIPSVSASSLILCMFFLFYTFTRIPRTLLRHFVVYALTVTLLFQSVFVLYQYYAQRSLFGYIPFGEVDYQSPYIVKGVTLAGSIYKLPYGTTVHPNILAGFFVLSYLILLLLSEIESKKQHILLFLVPLVICILTNSISAFLALIGGVLVYAVKKTVPQQLFVVSTMAIPIVSLFLFSVPSFSSDISFVRRYQLQQIAIDMIRDHPFFGVGWNNFTLVLEHYGYVSNTVRFLQPVHNMFVLLVAELGIVGWIFWTYVGRKILHLDPQYFVLIIPLFIIGSLDHYLLTLTTGRMLVLLCLSTILLLTPEKRVRDKIKTLMLP